MTDKDNKWFKKALTQPFSKLIFALALTGAVTGTIGLILGSISVSKTNELKYFLTHDKKVVWGVQKIWMSDITGVYPNIETEFKIYFSDTAGKTKFYNNGNPIEKIDILWDGKYPDGYFKNKK